MKKSERVNKIIGLLDENYGTQKKCWLDYENPYQLLIATILSAQCTDKRVNAVTKELFKIYPDPETLSRAPVSEIEKRIRSVGLSKRKAENISSCAKILADKYKSNVPADMDALLGLPGVGRKTANVIRGNIYGIPSIVVDTHVARISKKLALTESTDPKTIEKDLEKTLPGDHWILWNIQLIEHGRSVCRARSPLCGECFLAPYCPEKAAEKKK